MSGKRLLPLQKRPGRVANTNSGNWRRRDALEKAQGVEGEKCGSEGFQTATKKDPNNWAYWWTRGHPRAVLRRKWPGV